MKQTAKPSSAQLQAADVAFRAGYAAFMRNDLRSAHAEFAKAVRLAPNIAPAHSAFGTVLLAEGDAHAAAASQRRRNGPSPPVTGSAAGDGTTAIFFAAWSCSSGLPRYWSGRGALSG